TRSSCGRLVGGGAARPERPGCGRGGDGPAGRARRALNMAIAPPRVRPGAGPHRAGRASTRGDRPTGWGGVVAGVRRADHARRRCRQRARGAGATVTACRRPFMFSRSRPEQRQVFGAGHEVRKLIVLMVTAFVDMVGLLAIIPLLPYYALRFGANGLVIGLLISSYAVAQLIAAPLWGRVSDRYGRRPALLA